MDKQDIYRNILDELSLIITEDSVELECIEKAKQAIEDALAVDLLAKHMLQLM